jgi:restriction system protein
MPRYWVIAPVESKPTELFDKVWQFDLANSVISIGWQSLGDVSRMSRDELTQVVASNYPDKPQQTKSLVANMLWSFYHEIRPGDLVIARRGRKTLAAVGEVTEAAVHTPGRNPAHGHKGFLKVLWREQPRAKAFPTVVFPMHTLAELSREQFDSFIEGSGPQAVTSAAAEAIEDPNSFVLEKYLEDFVVSNFETIFKGQLKLFEDADGNEGQQYATDIGPIDILAVEPASRSFVIIELKKGRPSDQVVGQTLRYMGWVKKNLCSMGQAVKGLIICRDHDPKLAYALEMTSGIDVRYYSVSLRLREAP